MTHTPNPQPKKTSPAIVFDLGNVLIGWDPRQLFEPMFEHNQAQVDYFLNNVCTMAWNEKQDAGRPIAEAIQERIPLFPDYEPYIRAYYDRWIEMITGPLTGSVEILDELKGAGYYLCALSNWSAETIPLVQDKYPFFNKFEQMVISGRVKVKKPDPKIYQILLERIGRPAEQCLFIDDSPKNTAAAAQLGFDTIDFESPIQLRQALSARGLL